jgi:hypothetical protein
MYGGLINGIWRTKIRADFRYTRFDSDFGRGSYRAFLFSRDLGEKLRFDLQAGDQNIISTFTQVNHARFVIADFDWFLSRHYFLGGGYTVYRGKVQNYDQVYVNLGYRF